MLWFLSIRFGPKYFLKMNIKVWTLAIYALSHTVKNVILDLYILLKSALKMYKMLFQRPM